MYAQLCKRLGDKAPNFDPAGKPCTFKRLLLSKCRDEFENRALLSQQYENKLQSSGNADSDLESKYLAKRKMLGNIKFIGELGKLEMLHESILLRCCEQLLVGRKKQPIPDQAEDLECLCHLLKTCGRILDTNKAKGIMDQYFERMAAILENERMPTRIRFLIQDIIEMRKNKWIPRKLGKAPDGPRTIQQVREDAYRDGCIYLPQESSPTFNRSPMTMGIPDPLEGMFFDKKKNLIGMDYMFGGGSYLGTGPGVIGGYDSSPPTNTNGFGSSESFDRNSKERDSPPSYSSSRGGGGGNNRRENGYVVRSSSSPPPPPSHTSGGYRTSETNRPDFGDRYNRNRFNNFNDNDRYNDNKYNNRYNNNSNNNHNKTSMDDRYRSGRGYNQSYRNENSNGGTGIHMNNGIEKNGERIPPRFKKIIQQKESAEVSLRPPAMLFKPKTPSVLPKSAMSKTDSPGGDSSLLGSPIIQTQSRKESPMIIKQGSLDKGRKDKNKGQKGPTREEVFTKVEALLTELWSNQKSVDEVIESWKEVDWLPSKMNQTAITYMIKTLVERPESQDRESGFNVVRRLIKDDDCSVNTIHCVEALNKMVSDSSNKDKKKQLAELASWVVGDDLMTLNEFASMVENNGCYPLFLLTLVRLLEIWGEAKLKEVFTTFEISLMDHVPKEDRNDERMAAISQEYGLTFLTPFLSIRREMSKELSSRPDPDYFYKWIKENVPEEFQHQPEFIQALYGLVIESIVKETTLAPGTDPTVTPSKSSIDKEKEMLGKYKKVLQSFLVNAELQLVAVYAIQVFCNSRKYPKGMLLRCFVNCYELDITDEKAFFQWKEDVKHRHIYPGKEKALFQVNSWLTWLEEAESEEDDDDDEEDED